MRNQIFTSLVLAGLMAGFSVAQEDEKNPRIDRPIKINGDEYKLGEITFNKKTREIRMPAEVIQDEVLLEYALVNGVMGKVHESLLATPARPINLQIVMKLLRYKESARDIWPGYDGDGNISAPMEDDGKGRVEFLVTSTDRAGKKKTFPVSDWIERRIDGEDSEERETMPAGRFAYTGSGLWEGTFIAENEGGFSAIYRYAGAMFNSFQDASDNDDVWYPKDVVPPIGTKVELTIKPLPDIEPSAGWKARQKKKEAEAKTATPIPNEPIERK